MLLPSPTDTRLKLRDQRARLLFFAHPSSQLSTLKAGQPRALRDIKHHWDRRAEEHRGETGVLQVPSSLLYPMKWDLATGVLGCFKSSGACGRWWQEHEPALLGMNAIALPNWFLVRWDRNADKSLPGWEVWATNWEICTLCFCPKSDPLCTLCAVHVSALSMGPWPPYSHTNIKFLIDYISSLGNRNEAPLLLPFSPMLTLDHSRIHRRVGFPGLNNFLFLLFRFWGLTQTPSDVPLVFLQQSLGAQSRLLHATHGLQPFHCFGFFFFCLFSYQLLHLMYSLLWVPRELWLGG